MKREDGEQQGYMNYESFQREFHRKDPAVTGKMGLWSTAAPNVPKETDGKVGFSGCARRGEGRKDPGYVIKANTKDIFLKKSLAAAKKHTERNTHHAWICLLSE